MLCPYCRTENRDERDSCYNCEKDLTMLRLLVNKAKSHFNTALELAERERHEEAIAELHNALDLDHSHVNSHVVLGTLYAKTGQIDNAVASWHEALRLDPRLEKAHDYIEKAELARRSLPVVRRQRLLVIALVVLVAVLGGITVIQNQPDPAPARIADARQAYENGNHGKALDLIRDVTAADEGRPSEASKLAGLLQDVILEQEHSQLAAARDALERGDYARARAKARDLLARNPSRDATRNAEQILEDGLLAAREHVENTLLAVQERRAAPADALDAIDMLESLEAPDQEHFLAAARNQLAVTVRTFRVERAVQAFDQGQVSVWDLLGELARLRSDYPDYELLDELTVRFASPLLETLRQTGAELVENSKLADAAETVRSLTRLHNLTKLENAGQARAELLATLENAVAAKVDDALEDARIDEAREQVALLTDLASGRVPELASRIEGVALQTRLEEMRKAAAANQHEEVIALAGQLLQAPALTEEAREEVTESVEYARQRLADQYYKWMLDRDWHYYYDQLTEQDARTTLDYCPVVREHLLMRSYPNHPPKLLLFAAMANRTLGNDAEANDMLREIRDKYPDSNMMQYVEKYLPEAPEKAPATATEGE